MIPSISHSQFSVNDGRSQFRAESMWDRMMASVRLPSTTQGRVSQVERIVEEQQLQIRDLHGEIACLQHHMNELHSQLTSKDRRD